MMHIPARLFAAGPPLDRTVFHPDGTRTVTGPLGTVRYGPDGTATFLGPNAPERPAHATQRWDLAA